MSHLVHNAVLSPLINDKAVRQANMDHMVFTWVTAERL